MATFPENALGSARAARAIFSRPTASPSPPDQTILYSTIPAGRLLVAGERRGGLDVLGRQGEVGSLACSPVNILSICGGSDGDVPLVAITVVDPNPVKSWGQRAWARGQSPSLGAISGWGFGAGRPHSQWNRLVPHHHASWSADVDGPRRPRRIRTDAHQHRVLLARSRPSPVRATRAAYRSDFAMFREWCQSKGVNALPTITRRCAAIRYAHRLADLEPPTNSEHVRATLRGIRRTVGAAPARKAPVLAEAARATAPFRSRGPQGPPGPRAAIVGLRRGVSPVRARGA
jgi:hypothetical protein